MTAERAREPDATMTALPVEIAGLAGRLPSAQLAAARERAARLGIGADEVLLADGAVTPELAAAAAAAHLGLAVEPLDGMPSPAPPPEALRGMMRSGLLRQPDGSIVVAARGRQLRRLADELEAMPALRMRLRLTTPERLAQHVRQHFAGALGQLAAFALRDERADQSAATLGLSRYLLVLGALACVLLAGLALITPAALLVAPMLLVSLVLLGWSLLRLVASTTTPEIAPPPPRDDAALPAYSLIVPLYREARVVPQLIEALAALDYPPEKLQVLLVVEPDDAETAAALARHVRRPGFDILVAPDAGPRTKPKALNAALPFARGEIVGIYDAEDVPEPQQLRRACSAFAAPGNRRVGCVQARLAIDNVADSWITRQFAAEYAAHFDVVLPLLASARLPLPLGGTSNHFRRVALDRVGAWDPFNVAEDADLGVRLARGGWRTLVIASSTDEEAPRTAGAWLRQRTRWYKGWMQTLLVHGRTPRRLLAEIGWSGVLSFLLLLGGGLVSALMHPVFALALGLRWSLGAEAGTSTASLLLEGLGLLVLLTGYGATALCTLVGMRHRRLSGLWQVLPLIPLYWLMLSLAGWRALFQLIAAPQRWEKTEHGLARTSRRRPVRLRLRPAASQPAARRGRPSGLRNTDAAPPPHRPADA
ncbi:glycosyltransferase [Ancylobacter sp. Lp-2]|uniref:glycosyltransferase n=1 Tax=Ancylobacter sp. Lp-2 TaxID=2881339 RepID=UPI001E5FB405|nr:glycosyltransferase [Ancylobacter sp. Lp-2]MCB4769044.1 glycosyltransferase [Ancylobacter sp. Lp-2]